MPLHVEGETQELIDGPGVVHAVPLSSGLPVLSRRAVIAVSAAALFILLVVSLPASSSSRAAAGAAHGHHDDTLPAYSEEEMSPNSKYAHLANSSKALADSLLADLFKRIGSGRGPVIVGGARRSFSLEKLTFVLLCRNWRLWNTRCA